MNTVEQIKDRLSIEEVVGRYVSLKNAGGNLKGLCPFHSEKTPSFMVSPARQTYHCFGCGVGGDIFSFVEAMEGLDFKGALKVLAEQAGVAVVYAHGGSERKDERDRLFAIMEVATEFFVNAFTQHADARAYMHDRGFTDETLGAFRIGFAQDDWHALESHLKERGFTEREMVQAGLIAQGDKGYYDRFRSRIMFPISDAAGRVVAFSGRIFGTSDTNTAKYVNSPETDLYHKSDILYGFDRAKHSIRKNNFAIVVEGQMDLLATHQAHYANTVALSGTALTAQQLKLISRMSHNVVLALDADEAGIQSATKSARVALRAGFDVKIAALPEGNDPADILAQGTADAWKGMVKEATHIIDFMLTYLKAHAKDERAYRLAVREQVLPFVLDIESAIDTAHFVARIAERIGVSPESVAEDVARAHTTLPPEIAPAAPGEVSQRESLKRFGTARTALAHIIAWQESIGDDAWIDTKKVQKTLCELIGTDAYTVLASEAQQDTSSAFTLEDLYTDKKDLQTAVEGFIERIERDEITHKLETATAQLKVAEYEEDQEHITTLLHTIAELTKQKASLAHV